MPETSWSLVAESDTFTDAQIKAIPSVPLTLIAAPGIGRVISVVSVVAVLDTTAGAYADTGTNDLDPAAWQIVYGSASGASGLNLMKPLLAQTAKTLISFPIPLTLLGIDDALTDPATRGGVSIASAENKAISLLDFNRNLQGDYTGGHASNSLIVYVLYRILNI